MPSNKQNHSPPSKKQNKIQGRRNNNATNHVRQLERHAQSVVNVSPRTMIRSIMPDKIRSTLKYCSSKGYSSGLSGIVGSTQLFALAGLADPDVTGIGHQPYGFDQLTPFYSVYAVLAAKVSMTVTASSDIANFLAWAIVPQSSSTTLAAKDIEQCSELDELNFIHLGAASSGVPIQQVNIPRLNLPKIEGLTYDAYLGNPQYRSATSFNPAASTKLYVGIGNSNSGTAQTAIITVEIFFDCIFEGRQSLPQS